MPSEQIYLLEIIVKKIELQSDQVISDTKSLSVGFKFAQIINFEVDTMYFSQPELEEPNGRTVMKNYGKTYLFVSKPSDLRQLLVSDPYQITLYDGNKTIGFTTEFWKREFSEMIKFFESLGIVKSTAVEDMYELQNDRGVTTAKIDVFLRMSCFGQNLQTMFQIKQAGQKQEFIFRQRNTSRTFKVEKHADERWQPLVAPLYSAITDTKSSPGSQVNMKENVSLTQLFERDFALQKDSNFRTPDPVTFEDGIRLDFQDDFDKVSICFRPSENKFFDLLDLISADVKTKDTHTEVTFQRKKVDRVNSFLKSVGGDLKLSPNIVIEEDENVLEMTADKIAKKLCGNKDCPAVKKFKEYGIGPLATGKSLGTVYGDVEPPVTYGISHTYGTMREYGPYGVFSRPKQEELPFIAQNDLDFTVKPCKIRKEQPTCERKTKQKKKKHAPQWHSKSCPLCPERLRGGADTGLQAQPGNEDAMLMTNSPMIECKSVMDQFDSILAEYKRALGPCGQATCPYAQNLADDTCRKMCNQPPSPVKDSSSMSCNGDPCDVEGCPYAEAPKKKRYPSGCGNPKCAYTKYKLGLLDDDAEMELKFLPSPLAGNCGDPNCNYPFAAPLPPIHWDCPDPLPKGTCRNLNCPFQPAPLKKFKTKQQLKTGPCGSPMCAYALPQPCGAPTCPFIMRPCPMAEKQKQKPARKKCPSESEENLCQNPECPFSEKNAGNEVVDDINDPKFEGEFQDCGNPNCPFKQRDKKKKSKKKLKKSSCGNPKCPSAKPDKSKKKIKSCEIGEEDSICSNPECPDKSNKDKKQKNRCEKSSSSESSSVCSDPQCPFASPKKGRKSKEDNRSEDTLSAASCHKKDEDSVCSNPECPEQKARTEIDIDRCDQPGCPYSTKPPNPAKCYDPNCPYLLPLPSCGIPNCPYEPVPLRYLCKNPKCPSRQVDFKRKSGETKFNEVAEAEKSGKENVSVIMETTLVCEQETPCDNSPNDCENPDCEMKESTENKETGLVKHKKKGRRKKRGKFVYSIGDTYPGTKLGHRECVTPVFNVPPHMGWLWNIFTPILSLKPRRGWRPGALTKTIAARIRAHHQSKGLGLLKVPNFKKDGGQFEDAELKVTPKPTLQIQKKDGVYWITMNPLKDPCTLVENEDPYMECTPMTFKISKNKKPEEQFCLCDGDAPDILNSDASSDSELDIEFTPPAGIIHPERFKKRPNVVCCDAQYDPKDFEVKKKKDDKKAKGKGKDKKGKGGKGKKGGKKK
ncbi:hypothetical protein HUJ04_005051 [Dendroctonus ponderosae]|uniref:DUF4776 domain-containing protein n=1 Tax=Dendroctonus ponderosae TaxID=77166 RepID=A0AAR5PCT9_DENPD|nr:hypothetical protein HUJ04_005051 [Dendroctonus ponderosae]